MTGLMLLLIEVPDGDAIYEYALGAAKDDHGDEDVVKHLVSAFIASYSPDPREHKMVTGREAEVLYQRVYLKVYTFAGGPHGIAPHDESGGWPDVLTYDWDWPEKFIKDIAAMHAHQDVLCTKQLRKHAKAEMDRKGETPAHE